MEIVNRPELKFHPAFTKAFHEYYQALVFFAYQLIQDRSEAQDIRSQKHQGCIIYIG